MGGRDGGQGKGQAGEVQLFRGQTERETERFLKWSARRERLRGTSEINTQCYDGGRGPFAAAAASQIQNETDLKQRPVSDF